MSDTISTYTFLPWLRQGIANKIGTTGSASGRATIPISLKLKGKALQGADLEHTINRQIALYGPGDIIGIDKKAIVKNEPRNWITNFEPNYMPYIEFYDEDFPWRYSPVAVDQKDRLKPWVALVVLKEDEFEESKNMQDKPLAYIKVTDTSASFQPADQLWAWAHVHVNEAIIDEEEKIMAKSASDIKNVLSELQDLLAKNPDLAYSRLMCPRKLEPNVSYHAFLIPSFETGRLSGLGLDPSKSPDTGTGAWEDYNNKQDNNLFPVYHRWNFKTGTLGDFEYLVRLLEPKQIDSRVGRRPIDVQHPGSNVRGITDPELGGILKLGGALKIPFDTLSETDKEEVNKYDNWDQDPYPHYFQKDLAAFINLADEYSVKTAARANKDAEIGLDPQINEEDKDPLITAPLYGRWHALQQRLLQSREGSEVPNKQNWIHELNLDPRYRVPAGFGTGVIQKNQEEYMEAAWKQVGDILEANRKIRQAQMAREASWVWYDKHLRPTVEANPEKAFFITRPVQARAMVKSNNGEESSMQTVYYTVKKSRIPLVVTSTAMRRILRPGSRLMKNLPFDQNVKRSNLIERINKAEVYPAPPKIVPEDLPTVEDVRTEGNNTIPEFVVAWIKKYSWLKTLLIILMIILFFVMMFAPGGVILTAFYTLLFIGSVVALTRYNKWKKQIEATQELKEEYISPEYVDKMPKSSDFNITLADSGFTPKFGDNDSSEAVKFKNALRDNFNLIEQSRVLGEQPEKPKIELPELVQATFTAINPQFTIPKLVDSIVFLPPRIKEKMKEQFVEAMAYPEFDIPMYKPLKNISAELFLPNINFIGQNSISLLETNQKFIEAYMVGLNHEFARELLWREYSTDQRGSYFRQFWDVSSHLPEKGFTEEEWKEKMRDIPPLHRWSKFSKLGDHDHREEAGEKENEVVLVIRGELLKKYPNAVIYAHRAAWQTKDNGSIDSRKERVLKELTQAEAENPPKTVVKTPLYEAKVDPDITFFGFDLTAEEARGGTGDEEGDGNKPGWFFVIKERPGEPTFGLDIEADEENIDVWNGLSWKRVSPNGNFLEINTSMEEIIIGEFDPDSEEEKKEQNREDKNIVWNKDMNAAELAYVLYQVPVMVAVHAAEMLPKP
ncbi:hypothetical protein SAMN05660776_0937 [Salegentibacter holothuriorum]|uniref:Uncharacterized protein n=1 Tax=Salegentibacter holothuriorum TaxID=241145 RepID=A0A1T5AXK4_9FLAO|nr:hypothetical protein [Salegentibacter holothuriorum]SKB39539.1 hypothetical protein SAMN05660776_0937 [Salegentibacter holothuriorum]